MRAYATRTMRRWAVPLVLTLLAGPCLAAAPADDPETDLAKKTQNPVADLISVPFQSNINSATGSRDKAVYVLNVQPVIPIKLTEDLNLITRIIMPIINQPTLVPGMGNAAPRIRLAAAGAGAVPLPQVAEATLL